MNVENSGDLLMRSHAGDPRALQSLLVQHMPALEAFVRLRLGAKIRAKESLHDVVQSVCVEVLRDAEDFEYRGEAPFRAWLFKQALHKIVNKNAFWGRDRRDVGRELAAGPAEDSGVGVDIAALYATMGTPSRVLQAREAEAAFEKAFDQLPDDYREAITLHRLAGLSHAEIAEQMGRSEGATRNLVHRGLARLSLLLDGAQG
ncbi:MAG: sigma-70 family RNA polymerase sigma factor [Planctomycetota bacterium]